MTWSNLPSSRLKNSLYIWSIDGSEDTPRPSWYDLMPEKKRKADEEMRVYRDDVMDIAKGILRDKQIIDDIFVVVEKEGESDQDEGSDATDEMQDEAIGDGGFPDNASFDQGGEDIEQTREIQDDHQADSFLDDPMENDMEEHTNDDQVRPRSHRNLIPVSRGFTIPSTRRR